MSSLLHKASQKVLRKASKILSKADKNPQSQVQDLPAQENSSHNAAPSIVHGSPSNNIPRNILAFRTITSLLSKIQQEQRFIMSSPEVTPGSDRRQELKLFNAFSTVAIIDHEIVAVVSKSGPEGLALAAYAQDSEQSEGEPRKTSPSSLQQFEIIATQNYRRHNPQPNIHPTGGPRIDHASAQALSGSFDDTDESVKAYANELWSRTTITQHLYILSRLLTLRDPTTGKKNKQDITNRLLKYVVATCYPKMNRRLNEQSLSTRYIKSLKNITTFKFNESILSDEEPTKEEVLNDKLFLVKFVLTFNSKLSTMIPNIEEQAMLASTEKPFRLYSKVTRMEFHNLLNELLSCFSASLKDLKATRDEGDVPTKGSARFKDNVIRAVVYGYALQRLAKGFALRHHLQNIVAMLQVPTTMPKSGEKPDEKQEELEDLDDLQEVQPSITYQGRLMPLWESYISWLRLILAHFDAIEILSDFVTSEKFGHFNSISVQVLVAPPVDQSSLPWRELFDDSSIFSTKDDSTNKVLLKYLDAVLKVCSGAADAKQSWKNLKSNKGSSKEVTTALEELKSSNLPGWKECSEELIEKMNDWRSNKEDISQDLDRLCEDVNFFDYLKEQPAFSGTLHCEACLASLFDEEASAKAGSSICLKDFIPVIGVSKRCCPVCTHLLDLLGKRGNHPVPFVVRGSHNTVTPCTLPTWLPKQIVDSMNTYFGAQLKKELQRFKDRSTLLLKRAASTGSERLSSDSSREVGDADTAIQDFIREFRD